MVYGMLFLTTLGSLRRKLPSMRKSVKIVFKVLSRIQCTS